MDRIRAKVRFPTRVLHFFSHPFELALPDVGKVHPVRGGGRLLIEEERLAEPLGSLPRHPPRKPVGLLDPTVAHRDKGDYVNAAHTGVLALVTGHVDYADGCSDCLHHRIAKVLRLSDYRYNTAVVVGIGRVVKQLDPLLRPKAIDNPFNFLKVAPLAEIRHRLDDFVPVHRDPPLPSHFFYYSRKKNLTQPGRSGLVQAGPISYTGTNHH